MAIWFLLRKAVILTILCQVLYAEEDLLENLKPKRNDPPELVDFLESLLQVKDEFKKIREAASHQRKRFHYNSLVENNFLADEQDDSDTDTSGFSLNPQQPKNNFKTNLYSTENKDNLLKRRFVRRNAFRPINDVYPYMYDGNDRDIEIQPDEREERSSWKDVKERKHIYGKNTRDIGRYRRGLDLNDYSSDKDFELGNVKVLPRSRTGVRTVPGNKYEQRRGIFTNFGHKLSKRWYKARSKPTSKAFFWRSVPYTERPIPNDYSPKHNILELEDDSMSNSKYLQNYKNKMRNDQNSEDNTYIKQKIKKKSNFQSENRQQLKSTNTNRAARSLKLNIIDDNNLIHSIKHNDLTQSVVLTLKGKNTLKTRDNVVRNLPTTFQPKPRKADAENPSKEILSTPIDSSQRSLTEGDVIVLEQNEKYFGNVKKQKQDKISETSKPVLVYQIDEDDLSEGIEPSNIHSPEQKKTMLEDVDLPTSAIEQFQLSTKPYISAPKSDNIATDEKIKGIGDLNDFMVTTSSNNNIDPFLVKETQDMVHGKRNKGFVIIDKRSGGKPNKFKTQNKMAIKQQDTKSQESIQTPNDYDGTVGNINNKLDNFKRIINNHDSGSENQLIEELSNAKLDYSEPDDYQLFNYYYHKPQVSFQKRKLQFFAEDENGSDELNRYGNLDYENGRSRRINETDFVVNKIRVKRGLTDLFGMTNDEDYSEDIANDNNPVFKQERSDDIYDEESDSAVAETQTYGKRKNNQNKFDDRFNFIKNENNVFTLTEAFNEKVTERPAIYDSSKQANDVDNNLLLLEKANEAPKTTKIRKSLVNGDNIKYTNLNYNNVLSNGNNEYHDCKHCKALNVRGEKCNCDTGIENSNNKKCKNCNQGKDNTNKHTLTEIGIKREQRDNEEGYEKTQENNYENDNIDKRLNTRNCTKEPQTIKTEDPSACQSNTFHSKITSTSTELSELENRKHEKEEANVDQVNYKFEKLNHKNCSKNSLNTSNENDEQINKHKTVNAHNEKASNTITELKPAHTEQKLTAHDDLEESDSFAHHPNRKYSKLPNNSLHPPNSQSKDPKAPFPVKCSLNKFNDGYCKSEHEELPDLETVKGAGLTEKNIEKRVERSNADSNYPRLTIYADDDELENKEGMKEDQKIQIQNNDDKQFSVNQKAAQMNTIKHADDFNVMDNEGESYADFILSENAKERNELGSKQNYDNTLLHKNVPRSVLDFKENPENFLLNTVDSFDNIIEEDANERQVNKREANRLGKRSKLSSSNEQKHANYIDSIKHYIDEAPFEKFSKFDQMYWKKPPVVQNNKMPYAHPIYKTSNIYDNNKDSQMLINLKHKIRNPDKYNYIPNIQPSQYTNNNNLRRVRRDHLSKIAMHKNEQQTLKKNTDIEEDKNADAIVRRANDGKCNKNSKSPAMKQWINPKGPGKKHKPCFLGEEKDVAPNLSSKHKDYKEGSKEEGDLDKGVEDYGQMHDALNGHLASLIVKTIYTRLKQHKQLNDRFSHGLYRQHGFKTEMKDLDAFRNTETEGDIKHTEEMLHQIMSVLNKIILDQVRRRTCKHLSPDIQKYLASIVKVSKSKEVDEDAKISEEGFPLPLVKSGKVQEKPVDTEQGNFLFDNAANKPELEQNEIELKKKVTMIKGLLEKYKHMSTHCKIKFEDVEAYLKKHLCILQKMLKQLNEEQKAEKKAKQRAFIGTNKLKRKNYDLTHIPFNFEQPALTYDKQELINRQLESVGLGSKKMYTPSFNLDKMIQNNLKKLNENKHSIHSIESSKTKALKSQSNYGDTEDSIEQFEDYDNPKNELKRETSENEAIVSDQYKKLVQAAESIRNKRAIEERLGKLFGKTIKRSIKNENGESRNSINKDFSNIGFEAPMVFSLNK